METNSTYILYGLSGIIIALCAIILLKLKTLSYLLEQPVVKKMGPELKLKPVKIEDRNEESRHSHNRNQSAGGNNPNRNRPPFERTEGSERHNNPNRHDRAPRSERPEMGGGGDRGPRPDRGNFRDRAAGGNDRGNRPDRHERHGNGENRGRRPEIFSNEKEATPVEGNVASHRPASSAPVSSHEGHEPSSAPVQSNFNNAPLAPRRPLPSTVTHEMETKSMPMTDIGGSNADANDALFARDDSDIQHGRRSTLKKKPRFDLAESDETVASEETKV